MQSRTHSRACLHEITIDSATGNNFRWEQHQPSFMLHVTSNRRLARCLSCKPGPSESINLLALVYNRPEINSSCEPPRWLLLVPDENVDSFPRRFVRCCQPGGSFRGWPLGALRSLAELYESREAWKFVSLTGLAVARATIGKKSQGLENEIISILLRSCPSAQFNTIQFNSIQFGLFLLSIICILSA